MVRLQGQDDLTLVRFLLSCSSTGEVAEYITAYLGKSADVSKFTSEFLRRKYAEASGKKVCPCFCGIQQSHSCALASESILAHEEKVHLCVYI